MNEEELQRDILFQIDMQLYDKYNKKIAGMNDHLGDIYTYRDIEEVEQAQKDEKIDLLTKAIKELQKEIERLKKFEKYYENEKVVWQRKDYISIDKIKEIKEYYKNRRSNMTQIIFSKYGKTQQTFNQAVVNEVIKVLDEILGE